MCHKQLENKRSGRDAAPRTTPPPVTDSTGPERFQDTLID
jgi:hypothetical protein